MREETIGEAESGLFRCAENKAGGREDTWVSWTLSSS
jgi:hypothetical protein